MTETNLTKRCPKCNKKVPLSGFSRNRRAKDGLTSWCKACSKSYQKARREHAPAKMFTPQDQQRWRREGQERFAARAAIVLAKKDGRLPPVTTHPCADCGGQAKHYHHENGYAEAHALDVVPLCTSCHAARHISRRWVQSCLPPNAPIIPRESDLFKKLLEETSEKALDTLRSGRYPENYG